MRHRFCKLDAFGDIRGQGSVHFRTGFTGFLSDFLELASQGAKGVVRLAQSVTNDTRTDIMH